MIVAGCDFDTMMTTQGLLRPTGSKAVSEGKRVFPFETSWTYRTRSAGIDGHGTKDDHRNKLKTAVLALGSRECQ